MMEYKRWKSYNISYRCNWHGGSIKERHGKISLGKNHVLGYAGEFRINYKSIIKIEESAWQITPLSAVLSDDKIV